VTRISRKANKAAVTCRIMERVRMAATNIRISLFTLAGQTC
jgi:hypothetical protein